MAYQIKKRNHYVEQLELADENGNVVHTLNVDLDPGAMAEELSRKYMKVAKVKEDAERLKNLTPEAVAESYERIGNAVIEMLEVVFGKANMETLLDFYSGRYGDLITDIIPFVRDVVVPNVRRLAQEQRKEVVSRYSRKARRRLKK
jgi:hypothetical protein